MRSTFSRSACALMLLVAIPAATFAQPRGGGGRPPAPAPRPAPVVRAAPPARPAPPNPGGFNLNRDINPRPAPVQPPPPVTPQRSIAPGRPINPGRPITPGRTNTPGQTFTPPQPAARGVPNTPRRSPIGPSNPPPNFAHAPYTNNSSGGPYQGRFHGPVVRNPHAPGGAYGWNHGHEWRPAPIYWGGGFWGSYALAALTGALLFGSIVDYQNQVFYPSYQVEPDSPGDQLLQDYGLQQTQCGPPDLVVIWGPNNSVICAFPNDSVAPGNYEIDPTTFTLVPSSP